MATLEDELLRLYAEGLISGDDAVSKANRPEDVKKRVAETAVKTSAPSIAATSGISMGGQARATSAGPAGAGGGASSGVGMQGVKMRMPAAAPRK